MDLTYFTGTIVRKSARRASKHGSAMHLQGKKRHYWTMSLVFSLLYPCSLG